MLFFIQNLIIFFFLSISFICCGLSSIIRGERVEGFALQTITKADLDREFLENIVDEEP